MGTFCESYIPLILQEQGDIVSLLGSLTYSALGDP